METPVIKSKETVCALPPHEGNPRNSEGDFARLRSGKILFAYSRFDGDSASDDAACNIAGMISADNGKTFVPLGHLLVKAESHGVKNIMSVSFKRLVSGELCLFYLCKKGIRSEYRLVRAIGDETEFSSPELCIPLEDDYYYVINNARICSSDTGELYVPCAMHRIVKNGNAEETVSYFAECCVFSADRNARNWEKCSGGIKMPYRGHSGTGLQEPGMCFLPDGRMYVYARTDQGFQFESFSSDGGKSFTVPVPSEFTAPDSPMLIVRNPYSKLFCAVWNPIPNYNGRIKGDYWITAGRTPLVLAFSRNGTDFSPYVVLEDGENEAFCYPAVFFLSETELLISYCCGEYGKGSKIIRAEIFS